MGKSVILKSLEVYESGLMQVGAECRPSNRARHSLIEQIELLHSAACLQLPFQQNVQALYDII